MAKAEYRSAVRSRRMIQQAFADMLQVKSADKITVTAFKIMVWIEVKHPSSFSDGF